MIHLHIAHVSTDLQQVNENVVVFRLKVLIATAVFVNLIPSVSAPLSFHVMNAEETNAY